MDARAEADAGLAVWLAVVLGVAVAVAAKGGWGAKSGARNPGVGITKETEAAAGHGATREVNGRVGMRHRHSRRSSSSSRNSYSERNEGKVRRSALSFSTLAKLTNTAPPRIRKRDRMAKMVGIEDEHRTQQRRHKAAAVAAATICHARLYRHERGLPKHSKVVCRTTGNTYMFRSENEQSRTLANLLQKSLPPMSLPTTFHPHLFTLAEVFSHRDLPYERELLRQNIKGYPCVTSVDWLHPEPKAEPEQEHGPERRVQPPVVVFVPGFGGHSQMSLYKQTADELCSNLGVRVAILHDRGEGGVKLESRLVHHKMRVEFLHQLLGVIDERFGSDCLVLGLGFSQGGANIVKHMQHHDRFSGALIVSSSLDYRVGLFSIEASGALGRMYSFALAQRHLKVLKDNAEVFEADDDVQGLSKIKSLSRLDAALAKPFYGHENVLGYHRSFALTHDAERLRKPVVLLHATDDPLYTPDAHVCQREGAQCFEHLVMVEVPQGGAHLSWLEKDFSTLYSNRVAFVVFRHLIDQHRQASGALTLTHDAAGESQLRPAWLELSNGSPATMAPTASSGSGKAESGDNSDAVMVDDRRCRWLHLDESAIKPGGGPVLYWMHRDKRAQDNWALLKAQSMAQALHVPLMVLYCAVPRFIHWNLRHHHFALQGMKEVSGALRKRNISVVVSVNNNPVDFVTSTAKEFGASAVVTDFLPLKPRLAWDEDLVKRADKMSLPVCQVDAHNIVPCWEASQKLEYAARTIRKKIMTQLDQFLLPFPELATMPKPETLHEVKPAKWDEIEAELVKNHGIDQAKVAPVDHMFKPGPQAGEAQLERFLKHRLKKYDTHRNDPTKKATSMMSPYLNMGFVSAQQMIRRAKAFARENKIDSDSIGAFVEESVVRSELTDNFCLHNPHYDSLKGAYGWAGQTLRDHAADKREHVYSFEALAEAKTHDDLWNSAQLQLVQEGKMHGFLRMYWAKKVLEWTESPKQALAFAQELNDKFALDGNDPNGYVGVDWSIMGTHDQGWAERPVFGKIRFMNYKGCKRKFDVDAFVAKYAGDKKRKSFFDKPVTEKSSNKKLKKSKKTAA
ncbi:Deoxyribodipyrimidine photo-lyase (DNA photolyase) (Photoreactivating enzyme) [Durusdinium trenchii]|uniref:Deoxyribodipyrimidine photo-lyase n=1 Tax=Durusdinium trenchii TaxID=1381693 RepID=A0ABP0SGI4_9DINO